MDHLHASQHLTTEDHTLSRTTPHPEHRREPEYRRLAVLQRITRKERALHADELRELEAMTDHAEWRVRTFADALLDENRERWTRSRSPAPDDRRRGGAGAAPAGRTTPVAAPAAPGDHPIAVAMAASPPPRGTPFERQLAADLEALARRMLAAGHTADAVGSALVVAAVSAVDTLPLLSRADLGTLLRALADWNAGRMRGPRPSTEQPQLRSRP